MLRRDPHNGHLFVFRGWRGGLIDPHAWLADALARLEDHPPGGSPKGAMKRVRTPQRVADGLAVRARAPAQAGPDADSPRINSRDNVRTFLLFRLFCCVIRVTQPLFESLVGLLMRLKDRADFPRRSQLLVKFLLELALGLVTEPFQFLGRIQAGHN